METALRERLIAVGERFERTVRFTREEIALFAAATRDTNPLHHDAQAAQRTRFGEIIASGEQTMSIMTGLLASHFSRSNDGTSREMLCLNLNFAFRHPVFAEQDLVIAWTVSRAEWNGKLGGMVSHVDGVAMVGAAPACVVARATILVKVAS
jgi:acyl dehydratase